MNDPQKNGSKKRSENRLPILDDSVRDRLRVGEQSGTLYWDEKEIVARRTFDFTGIGRSWAIISAFFIAVAGSIAATAGVVEINKEFCWFSTRSCLDVPAPDDTDAGNQKPPPDEIPPKPVTLSGIYFDTDSSVLKLESAAALDALLRSLTDDPALRIEIHGHTDNTGNASHNLNLSAERAASVVQWLVGKGIARERFASKGHGASMPLADNASGEGRAKNRRVEFVIVGSTLSAR